LFEKKWALATHAGIETSKPTIGVAKSYYKIVEYDELGERITD